MRGVEKIHTFFLFFEGFPDAPGSMAKYTKIYSQYKLQVWPRLKFHTCEEPWAWLLQTTLKQNIVVCCIRVLKSRWWWLNNTENVLKHFLRILEEGVKSHHHMMHCSHCKHWWHLAALVSPHASLTILSYCQFQTQSFYIAPKLTIQLQPPACHDNPELA